MSGLARFSIDVDALGHGRVEVNGVDVSRQVSGVAVVSDVGAPTMVTLRHVAGTAEIAGEGIVHVTPAEGDVVSFLNHIDASELERRTLERLELGSGSPIAEALELLKEWARGGA